MSSTDFSKDEILIHPKYGSVSTTLNSVKNDPVASEQLGSDSEDEEYISSEDLIERLEEIIENTKKGVYTDVNRQDISDALEEYISGNAVTTIDPDAISYLFRGWWITDALRRISNPDLKSGEIPPPLENCPFCLKKMDSKDESNTPKEESIN